LTGACGPVCTIRAGKQGSSGLGLGLAIARQGVSANGGEISVRNITGQGCVFTVELPRLPLDAVGTLEAAEVAEVGAGANP
jgi:K+-sensing histidine kinase KdpD